MAVSSTAWPEVAAQTGGNNTWTNLANAQGSTTTGYATWTNATSGNTGRLLLSHFWGQGNMLGGTKPASIESVELTVWSYVSSTTNISALTVQLIGAVSGDLGSPTTLNRSATSTNSQTVTLAAAPPTWEDLAEIDVRLIATHGANSNSATYNVGAVRMKINYTSLVAPNKARSLKDTCSTTADALQWWAWPDFPATDGAGGWRIYPKTSGTYEYLIGLEPLDLRESSISLKLAKSVTTFDVWWGLTSCTLPFPVSGGGDVWMRQIWMRTNNSGTNNNLDMLYTENWADTVVAGVTYNAGTMAYQRIRHTGNAVYFDTSANGVTWTNRASYAESLTPSGLTYLFPFIRLGNVASGPYVTIDDINTTDADWARKYAGTSVALGGGSGTWTDPSCGVDDDNDVYATWAVP